MKKRSYLQIYVDILKVTMLGALKSHIVYKANLNFKMVVPYLDLLCKSDLLQPDGKAWQTTDKGLDFIRNYENLAGQILVPQHS